MTKGIAVQNWGHYQNQSIKRVTISDGKACSASIITYGAVLQDLRVPNANGDVGSVTLGLTNISDYVAHSPYMGAVVGRCANRIANGRYTHQGQRVQLDLNEPPHHLHGGAKGIDKRVWQLVQSTERSVTMCLHVPAFDDGYPGDFDVQCTYTFGGAGHLRVDLSAKVSTPCPINLAQHSYFNLNGDASGSVLNHELQMFADNVTICDLTNIPINSQNVSDTPYDFKTPKPIAMPLDNSFKLQGSGFRQVAVLTSPISGRRMRVFSDQPELQVYTGHGLNLPVTGIGGRKYGAYDGLCLEPQLIPNAPNTNGVNCFYGPDESYTQKIEYRFETI